VPSPEPGEIWERRAGASRAPLGGYHRRKPEKTVLHQVVRERLEPFLASARERSAHGHGLPAFVERELRASYEAAPRCQSALSGSPVRLVFSSSVTLLLALSCGDCVAGA
jgi:hypothetical protein